MEVEVRGLQQLKRSINANTSLFSTQKNSGLLEPIDPSAKAFTPPSKSTGLWELENIHSRYPLD